MQNVTKQSNCITNVWDSLTKGGGGSGAGMRNSADEFSTLKKKKIVYQIVSHEGTG